jgi:hypothetical protein
MPVDDKLPFRRVSADGRFGLRRSSPGREIRSPFPHLKMLEKNSGIGVVACGLRPSVLWIPGYVCGLLRELLSLLASRVVRNRVECPECFGRMPEVFDLLVYNYSRHFLTFPPARVAIKLNLLTLSA